MDHGCVYVRYANVYCILYIIRHLFTQMQMEKLRRNVLVFGSSCAALCLVLDTLRLCVPIETTIETTTTKKQQKKRMPNVA